MSWFKIHAEAEHSVVWRNMNAWRVLEWCLMHAAYQPFKTSVGNQIVLLERGQLVFTYRNAEAGTGLSQNVIRGAIKFLVSNNTVSMKTTNKYSVLTIVNYNTYQGRDDDINKQNTIKSQTDNKQITHYTDITEVTEEQITTLSVDSKTPASPVNDSEPSNPSGCTLEPQTSIQGQRKRKQRVRSKEAQMVFEAWEYKRSDDKFDEQLDKNIAKRLKEGYTIEELVTCVKRAMPEEAKTDPNYRKKASNFFGNAGYFKPYLDENFTEPEPKRVSPFGTLEEQMEAFGLVNTYKWTPEDDLIHIPTPEEEAAKWDAFFEREKKREQEEAHEHTLVS